MTKTAAAVYTEVTLDEMKKLLMRNFHALKPKQGTFRGETVFVLHLSENVGIRVYTSIGTNSTWSAGAGQDAIRVLLISLRDEGPLKGGKAPIVKRTQGWRNTLVDKISDAIEAYYESQSSLDGWAGSRSNKKEQEQHHQTYRQTQDEEDSQGEIVSESAPHEHHHTTPSNPKFDPDRLRGDISPAQFNYLKVLVPKARDWAGLGLDKTTQFSEQPSREQVQALSKGQASRLIDALVKVFPRNRYAHYFE